MIKTNILVTLAFDDISTENIDTELQIQKDILKLLEKCKKEGNISHYVVADDEVISNKLKEQEPKIGHWILSDGYWRCSNCKGKALLKFDNFGIRTPEYIHVESNYCPNCGAKMTESEE